MKTISPDTALILVDVQHDFLPGGALAVPQGDEILPIIAALQPQFDHIVATQDCIPRITAALRRIIPKPSQVSKLYWEACLKSFGQYIVWRVHPVLISQLPWTEVNGSGCSKKVEIQ